MTKIVQCPGCDAKLSVNDDALGQKLACPKCSHQFVVGAQPAAPQPPAAPQQPTAPQQPAVPQPVTPDPLMAQPGGENLDSFFDGGANPYQQPMAPIGGVAPGLGAGALGLAPADVKKIEAIISDARMVALAVLLCLLCSGCGFIIIGPWYFVRLTQWNQWATNCPGLVEPTAEYGSLPQRFQASRSRLIAGLVIGAIMLVLAGCAILLTFTVA